MIFLKYNINGVCELSINPYDPVFVKKLSASILQLDKLQNKSRKARRRANITVMMKIDKEMCTELDSVFSANVSDALDIRHSISGRTVVGPPTWANIVLDTVEQLNIKLENPAKGILAKYGACRGQVKKNDKS